MADFSSQGNAKRIDRIPLDPANCVSELTQPLTYLVTGTDRNADCNLPANYDVERFSTFCYLCLLDTRVIES
jgi:hypothetical protein